MTHISPSFRTTGALPAFLAAMLLGSFAVAADTVAPRTGVATVPVVVPATVPVTVPAAAPSTAATAYQQRLDNELQRINQHYDDVRHELNEEYQAITEEKDENCNAIFEKVRALKAEREIALQRAQQQRDTLRETMANSNIPQDDQRFIAAASPLDAEGEQVARAYDNSLETLQQLYQLNGRRYNELLKIHNAREALEENRFRELRDLTAQSLRLDSQANRANLTDADRRELDTRQAMFEEEQRRDQDRYQTATNALDEYRDLVNSRIAAQRDYLNRYDVLMRELARPEITANDRTNYTTELAQLNAEKNLAEKRYQNDVRYIEEKLNFERLRGREMSRIADERRAVEAAWAQQDGRYADRRADLNRQLSPADLAPDEHQNLDTQLAALDRRYSQAKEAYNQALQNLDEREKLAERAVDERMAYLKDRNDIRVKMTEAAATEENFANFRDQIAQLEERRIMEERDIRNQMLSLAGTMPSSYRGNRFETGNMQRRMSRSLGRIDNMRENIQAKWQSRQNDFNEQIRVLDQRLGADNLSDLDRAKINEEKAKVQQELAAAEERFNRATAALDERRDLEQKRMTARADYMNKRRQLRDNLNAESMDYDDMVQYEQQLAALDLEFANQEKEYRASARPLASLMPADAADENWQDRMQASWERGVQRIDAEPVPPAVRQAAEARVDQVMPPVTQTSAATTVTTVGGVPTAYPTPANVTAANAAAARRNAAVRTNRHDGDGVWQSMKDAIRDTYHDAVNYLTD
ncbi:MAG: hypothetical protein LUC93_08720 [Planctomycetaceae bacterium]|nr:hypothetical protein [Planctomycetaceae bacterium]